MAWDKTTQAIINKAVAATKARWENKVAPQPPQGPSQLQETAASRAWRLLRQAGPNMNMETDMRYRKNMLGSEHINPIDSIATPMRKLRNALDVADKASERRVKADNVRKRIK